jgi:hypothetical protein
MPTVQEMIDNLVEMGFDVEKAKKALGKTGWNTVEQVTQFDMQLDKQFDQFVMQFDLQSCSLTCSLSCSLTCSLSCSLGCSLACTYLVYSFFWGSLSPFIVFWYIGCSKIITRNLYHHLESSCIYHCI